MQNIIISTLYLNRNMVFTSTSNTIRCSFRYTYHVFLRFS